MPKAQLTSKGSAEGGRQRQRGRPRVEASTRPGRVNGRRKGRASGKPRRRGFWARLKALLQRLFGGGRSKGRGAVAQGKGRKASLRAQLLPGAGQKRTLAQWKELRRQITTEVKEHLAQEQPVPAIKKLTRALLEDPQHPAYHELLKKAVNQRRQRRIKAGRPDPWADLPKDLRQEALQLEAFTAYVDELEQLFDKAGIPPLSAPPPPGSRSGKRPSRSKGESTTPTGA